MNSAEQLGRGDRKPVGDSREHASSGISLRSLDPADIGEGQFAALCHILLGEGALATGALDVRRELDQGIGRGVLRHFLENRG
jgi:hypothetical protein